MTDQILGEILKLSPDREMKLIICEFLNFRNNKDFLKISPMGYFHDIDDENRLAVHRKARSIASRKDTARLRASFCHPLQPQKV